MGDEMFGYIAPCKGQLGEEGFEKFSAYFCGLCKAMGRKCSQLSRLGLSYDAAFLALVLSSAEDRPHIERMERCMVHPFKKRLCIKNDRAVDYSASMGVLLSYLKLLDDWHDERSLKALAGMGVFAVGVHRAKRRYSEEYEYIKSCLDELSALEKSRCGELDRTADCFARILRRLFAPSFIEDSDMRRVLEWLGYNIGRWIYVLDAVNDMSDDYKNGAYNPLLTGFDGGDIKRYAAEKARELSVSLTFTLENAASAFELLKVYRNYEVIYRIVYDSLRLKQASVLKKLENPENEGIE